MFIRITIFAIVVMFFCYLFLHIFHNLYTNLYNRYMLSPFINLLMILDVFMNTKLIKCLYSKLK